MTSASLAGISISPMVPEDLLEGTMSPVGTQPIDIALAFIFSAISVIGVLGNLLVITVVLKVRGMVGDEVRMSQETIRHCRKRRRTATWSRSPPVTHSFSSPRCPMKWCTCWVPMIITFLGNGVSGLKKFGSSYRVLCLVTLIKMKVSEWPRWNGKNEREEYAVSLPEK